MGILDARPGDQAEIFPAIRQRDPVSSSGAISEALRADERRQGVQITRGRERRQLSGAFWKRAGGDPGHQGGRSCRQRDPVSSSE